ncbi:MAG: hypothetical protein MK319_04620 [Pseudomonadales bacterium]|nr:hypothetical protein [Pseudomonadales bacterium]
MTFGNSCFAATLTSAFAAVIKVRRDYFKLPSYVDTLTAALAPPAN